jgi:hypothetical protein
MSRHSALDHPLVGGVRAAQTIPRADPNAQEVQLQANRGRMRGQGDRSNTAREG